MADIHDYLEASNATDSALASLRTYGGQVEDGEREPKTAFAILLAADVLACAIREAATRIDYVFRDLVRH